MSCELSQVARATPSLLAKAFRGELVPQNPKDELAEKLLEWTRAQRNAMRAAALRRASP